MDLPTLHLLTEAAAALGAAMDCLESGSKEWELVLNVRIAAEELIRHEVNGTWPDAD